MAQFLTDFGDGRDGIADLSGIFNPGFFSCSGSSASTTLTIVGTSGWTVGTKVYIHQTRGTDVGSWEINQVVSSTANSITLLLPLANTYTDSGASQAQVVKMFQYSGVTVSSTLTAYAWDRNVGGILAFYCSGKTLISGTISAIGKGFIGGVGVSGADNIPGYQGEGTSGAGTRSLYANGTGAGAGNNGIAQGGNAAGGGGGHSAAGSDGQASTGAESEYGRGGNAGGLANLTTMIFGGAGGAGGGGSSGAGKAGGNSAGIIAIFTKNIEVTGTINAFGNSGVAGQDLGGGHYLYAGGGGSGGSVLIKAQTAILGTTKITATKGIGGTAVNSVAGGDGADGRIRIEACTITGTTNPAASTSEGGHSFCSMLQGAIL